MDRNRFIGGIVLLVLAAFGYIFVESAAATPIAITLTIVGIALIATSRKGTKGIW